MMARYGLRISGVLTARFGNEYFSVRVKGDKVRTLELEPETKDLLARAGVVRREPFAGIGKSTVQNAFSKIARQLMVYGRIRHQYSWHDLRHYFAVNLYRKTRDVYAVKEALGHATVSITEVYLAGLGAS